MRKARKAIIGAMVLTLLMAMAACNQVEPTSQVPTLPPAPPTVPPTAAPLPEGAESMTTASGLQYILIEEGSGPAPQAGDTVSVHYIGALEDGTQFDSSYSRGEPFQFALGQGQVILGWDEGIALMREGGRARLVIPPDLAYGEQGAGGIIPPNATLIFDVELVAVQAAGAARTPAPVNPVDYVTTESGLRYYDFVVGDGPPVQQGQRVTVHYTGWLVDGTQFDSSLDRGEPFAFVIGMGQVIRGWDEGVMGMRVGGQRQLVIPPELGYGAQGAGSLIPPNATLIFEVEVLQVADSDT